MLKQGHLFYYPHHIAPEGLDGTWRGVLIDIWWFSCHQNAPPWLDMEPEAFTALSLPPCDLTQINCWGYKSWLAVESLPVNPASAIKYPCAAEVNANDRFYTEIMAASVWDFKLSLSHTERGSDAEQAGGLIHDLNIISSRDIFLVLAWVVSSKCLPISQAVFMNRGKILLMMQI